MQPHCEEVTRATKKKIEITILSDAINNNTKVYEHLYCTMNQSIDCIVYHATFLKLK